MTESPSPLQRLHRSVAERKARLEDLRKQVRDLAATMSARGAARVLDVVEEDIAEIEREWTAQAEVEFAHLKNTGPAAVKRWREHNAQVDICDGRLFLEDVQA